jgi:hypothetical protein
MKQIAFSAILLGLAGFTACEPIEQRAEMSGAMSAGELNISAAPLIRDGVNSNYIALSCDGNAILPSWDYGTGVSQLVRDTVLLLLAGDNDIIFTGLNGDGSTISKTLTVHVDRCYDVPVEWSYLCGSGSKTWVFDADPSLKNGPYGNSGAVWNPPADWWGPGYGNFDEYDAKMTFSLDGGAVFTKTKANGATSKGSFSFVLKSIKGGWASGILTFKGVTIPHPVVINGPAEAFEFYINTLTEDQLILATLSDGTVPDDFNDGHEDTSWIFRPEGWKAP